MVGVRAQARLLLGRLETIGLGVAAAEGRRNYALYLERIWADRRRADLLSRVQGRALLKRGQFQRDLSSTWGLKPIFRKQKTISSGQKWFLMPYFPLIGGMLVLRSGL